MARAGARKPSRKPRRRPARKRDVHRDSMDFRDLIYRPALIPLASRLIPDRRRLAFLDQGSEGACKGFGLT